MIQSLKSIVIYSTTFLWGCCLYAQPNNITRVEYYIDTDPGYGIATPINLILGTNLIDSTVKINPAALTTGVHLFGIRAKDSTGWSLDNRWLFIKESASVNTPNIVRVEYYIDNDPGYGNATDTSIAPGTNLSNLTHSIDTASISAGVHIFGIRVKDANGAWSLDNKWLFVKDAVSVNTPDIVKVEYYIDNDPGYGNATDTMITQGTNLSNLTHSINPASISAGVHIFGIRAKDANGAWSLDNKWLFVKNIAPVDTPDIIKIEYYVDTDPGYDKATPLKIIPGINFIDSTLNVDSRLFADTTHTFGIRAKDANGAWSLDNKLLFIGGTLPIVLARFTGQYINSANELTAVIEQAVNVKAIQVERSMDGTHFTYVGDMAVAPVTSGTFKYDDKNPPSGNNFYRLRIVDIDGKASYSYVILLNHTSTFIVQMYPNPVQDNLKVHFENAVVGIYTIRVTDILGKDIFSHKVNISQNNQTGDVNIPFSHYAAGTYFIQVSDAFNKFITTQKIIMK